jgi:hypothetical protein
MEKLDMNNIIQIYKPFGDSYMHQIQQSGNWISMVNIMINMVQMEKVMMPFGIKRSI